MYKIDFFKHLTAVMQFNIYSHTVLDNLVWLLSKEVRKLTSTVDASPFFAANSCLVPDKNS